MNSVLQIRIDDELKKQATELYKNLGMDLSTAIRMFLLRSVSLQAMPFAIVSNEEKDKTLAAIKELQDISKANGNSELTLEEINEIIKEVRQRSKK